MNDQEIQDQILKSLLRNERYLSSTIIQNLFIISLLTIIATTLIFIFVKLH